MTAAQPASGDPYPVGCCPRCGQQARLDALSRTSSQDLRTMICAGCGTDEALEEVAGGVDAITPPSRWPLRRRPHRTPGWSDTWADERSNLSAQITPAPTPREVPDLRLHLLGKWAPKGRFEYLVGRMVDGDALAAAAWERHALRQAGLWWVSTEMAALTAAAAASIPDDIIAGDLVLPAGQSQPMAVLAEPWVALDANDADHRVHVDVVVWGRHSVGDRPTLSLSFYRYVDFGAGLTGRELRMTIESGALADATADLRRPGAHSLAGGAWVYIGRSDWADHWRLDDTSDNPLIDCDAAKRASYVEDRRWFSAFSVLVDHRLAEQETVYAPRATRRRGQRAGLDDKETSNVRLIRLRQPKRAPGESEAEHRRRQVDWTHRWIVGGHTAWRACGPGRTQRRLVYIAPFVKGPADRQLVVKTDVRMWVR